MYLLTVGFLQISLSVSLAVPVNVSKFAIELKLKKLRQDHKTTKRQSKENSADNARHTSQRISKNKMSVTVLKLRYPLQPKGYAV